MLRNMVALRLKEAVWIVLFPALLPVLGIFVSKQVSEPWGNLYYFLYDHLPGFNAFREASKFYILVVLGYSVGIGALVQGLLSKSNEQPTTDNVQQGRGRADNKQARKREDDPYLGSASGGRRRIEMTRDIEYGDGRR